MKNLQGFRFLSTETYTVDAFVTDLWKEFKKLCDFVEDAGGVMKVWVASTPMFSKIFFITLKQKHNATIRQKF